MGDRARDEQIPDLGADRVFHPRAQVGDLGHSAANPRGSLGGNADQQGLRPDGDVDRALGEPPMGKLEAEPADLDDAGVVVDAAEQALDAIGLAHEAGDEHVAGRVVEITGRALLGDHAAVHHDDPVGDRQRLLLVVGHVDHGDAEPPLQLADLLAHAAAQPRVQVGQRLVEQEHGRLEDEGAGDGHALLLAARQLAGQAVPEGAETDRGEAGARQSPRLPPAPPGDARPVGDIVEHAHVREQRIALEHHADVAPGRADVGDVTVADQDAAGRRRLEAGDQAERRRLAAARGAEQGDEGAGSMSKLTRPPRHRPCSCARTRCPWRVRPRSCRPPGDNGRRHRAAPPEALADEELDQHDRRQHEQDEDRAVGDGTP